MQKVADILIDLRGLDAEAFARQLGPGLGVEWRRDGILEEQVSTEHDTELCFRRDPAGEEPPAVLCLGGDDDQLEVATVVPLDRGIELSDDESRRIVETFHDEVVEPAAESAEFEATLRVPSSG